MTPINTETVFRGLALSGGISVGRVCLFNENRHSNLPAYKVAGDGVDRECARVARALKLVSERLERVRADVAQRIGQAEAEIFVAQRMILEDASLGTEVLRAIRERGCNAETAITSVLDFYEGQLQQVDDDYIKDRASDIGEVRRRLLDVLGNMRPSLQCGPESHCQRGHSRIVVAEELTPSLTLSLDPEHTIGFVTEHGGINSHAAILARALEIPAVSGVPHIHSLISCGTEVVVNGDTGEVIIRPSEETVRRLVGDRGRTTSGARAAAPVAGLRVMASISRAGDVAIAREMQAEGIGLYRTEFEFMAAGRVLTEDEQTDLYTQVATAMRGHPVYIRLLDVGGDKALQFLDIPHESNPCLGFRGARFLLGNPDLLRTQARALARASQTAELHVMYPMITGVEQFRQLRAAFAEATSDISGQNMRHGLMFEVPAACLEAERLFEIAEFGSIGSNDLIQYLFAVDRDNELVAHDYTAANPVFWEVLGRVAAAAHAKGRPISICGEAAGNPAHLEALMDAGIRQLSVTPRLIAKMRAAATQRGVA